MQETTFYLKSDQLTRLSKLEKIILTRNYIMHWGVKSKNIKLSASPDFHSLFQNLASLKHFEFTDSYLSNTVYMTLPNNLITVVVDKNEFSFLDLHHCSQLEEVSANDNILQNIPMLHEPLPPLKILRLKNNPLDKMTILTIAPLCQLKVLQLQFPVGSRYNKYGSDKSYCECVTLVAWIKKAKISGVETVECSKPPPTRMCSRLHFPIFSRRVKMTNYSPARKILVALL